MLTRFRVERSTAQSTTVDKGGVPHHDVSRTIRLVVASATRKHHANEALWNGLADGEIYLRNVRAEAAAEFRVGREFWIDIRATDEDPTKP